MICFVDYKKKLRKFYFFIFSLFSVSFRHCVSRALIQTGTLSMKSGTPSFPLVLFILVFLLQIAASEQDRPVSWRDLPHMRLYRRVVNETTIRRRRLSDFFYTAPTAGETRILGYVMLLDWGEQLFCIAISTLWCILDLQLKGLRWLLIREACFVQLHAQRIYWSIRQLWEAGWWP